MNWVHDFHKDAYHNVVAADTWKQRVILQLMLWKENLSLLLHLSQANSFQAGHLRLQLNWDIWKHYFSPDVCCRQRLFLPWWKTVTHPNLPLVLTSTEGRKKKKTGMHANCCTLLGSSGDPEIEDSGLHAPMDQSRAYPNFSMFLKLLKINILQCWVFPFCRTKTTLVNFLCTNRLQIFFMCSVFMNWYLNFLFWTQLLWINIACSDVSPLSPWGVWGSARFRVFSSHQKIVEDVHQQKAGNSMCRVWYLSLWLPICPPLFCVFLLAVLEMLKWKWN